MFPDKKFMLQAIDIGREGALKGQAPFGAVIVKDGRVVVAAHNVVWETTDITAHAEINAIRIACKKLNTIDLSGVVLYSSCEPCPMCFSALHWARVKTIVYGTSIQDAKYAGFNELGISNRTMADLGDSKIEIISDFLKEECQELFDKWVELNPNILY